ncbi:MAG: hydantoinase [Rhodospirillaceae bacterium]|nr:hydantoinase [Rhodospirillaceae bacterium]|tara:strand:- start:213 stop:1988 length:1776 start_codon:yes stop_codon:yes gene_type:complete
MTVSGLDLAIFSKRMEGVARKMQNTLLRSARSGVINTGRDFSCCVLTAGNELVAAAESLPIHVMAGPDQMAATMQDFHPGLAAGDAFLHNSPYHGCSHAADLSVLVPVMDDQGRHRFTVMAKAHQADIGNSVPTTYHAAARDVYEEGALIFAATRVQRDYEDLDDLIRMCELRIRSPEQWRGDYLAGVGSARVGERELITLAGEMGWDRLDEMIAAWFDYSERRMALAVAELPAGSAVGQTRHDPFPGTPADGIPIKAEIAVDPEGGRIAVDLTDNPDCLPNGLNLSEACARTAAMVGTFNSLGLDVPTNAGSFRRLDMALRENCVVGIPRHPTSCSVATQNVADRLTNAVHLAFANLADGYGMAEVGGVQTAAQAVISGHEEGRDGRPFVDQLILGDTLGAGSPRADGWLAMITTGTAGMSFFDSVEVDELRHPVLVTERRLVPDREGAGTFRGAPASQVTFAAHGACMEVFYQSDGTTFPALGARGGGAGAPARNTVTRRAGDDEAADGWATLVLEKGDCVTGVSPGGGGYGAAHRREPGRVAHDVAEGLVSVQRARDVYGVVLDTSGGVDGDATTALRRRLTNEEGEN